MRQHLTLLIFIMLPLLASCSGGSSNASDSATSSITNYAGNLSIQEINEQYSLVSLRNPWDTTKLLARYALVDRNSEIPDDVPEDAVVLRVPIGKSVIFSGVHASLITELGASKAVSGICDAEFVSDPLVKDAISDGTILDCGQSSLPIIEKIIKLRPEILLVSPFENSAQSGGLGKTGVPVVLAADYMEETPLGRAEWIRFYGRLFGKGNTADSLFNDIAGQYEGIKKRNMGFKTRPTVLFDKIYSGIWSVPTQASSTGHLIEDAGGENPFGNISDAGSVQLSPEKVLSIGRDADIWLIRYYEPPLLSRQVLAKENTIYSRFKAFSPGGRIYGVNTLEKHVFEDAAFHPHLILRELSKLLHPDSDSSYKPIYYSPIE